MTELKSPSDNGNWAILLYVKQPLLSVEGPLPLCNGVPMENWMGRILHIARNSTFLV